MSGVEHTEALRNREEIFHENQAVEKCILEVRSPVLFVNPTWFLPAVAPVEMPIGLNHLDSDFCWCDPIIRVDEDGQEVVLHRQVTWN
jgi:hypothetical protein